MTLSRWRRVVTGVAAGVIVLCGALIGASFRDDGSAVSTASELRPENVIPIAEDPVDDTAVDTSDTTDDAEAAAADDEAGDAITEPVRVVDTEEPAEDDSATGDAAATNDGTTDDDSAADDSATPTDDAATDDQASGDDAVAADESASDAAAATDEPAPEAPAPVEEAPLTATDDALGTGGGVDDAECALDRLVIYAGARRGGVAGSIRSALAQAGFGAGCPTPVTVLASNCPLQFSGVLGTGSGYDPNKSFVASSASVDRETMTAVMSTVGYSGNQIDILDFGFVNADQPGEQWMAIFIPPSFDGWQGLAGRAGLSPTTSSLCAPSGQLAG